MEFVQIDTTDPLFVSLPSSSSRPWFFTRVVGQAVSDVLTVHCRPIFLVARTTITRHGKGVETDLFAGSAGRRVSHLAHLDHDKIKSKLIGFALNPREPRTILSSAQYEDVSSRAKLSVVSASATSECRFIVVNVECYIAPPVNRAADNIYAGDESENIATGNFIFWPEMGLNEYKMLDLEPGFMNTAFVSYYRQSGDPRPMILVHRRALPRISKRHTQIAQREIIFQRKINWPILNNKVMIPWKLDSEPRNVAVGLENRQLGNDVQWCQWDPWDKTLIVMIRKQSGVYELSQHDIDDPTGMSNGVQIKLPLSLRSRFHRQSVALNTSREYFVNARRWIARNGAETYGMQLFPKRYTCCVLVHMTAVGADLPGDKLAELIGIKLNGQPMLRQALSQQCLSSDERCKLVLYMYLVQDVNMFRSIGVKDALDRVSAQYDVHSLCLLEDEPGRGYVERDYAVIPRHTRRVPTGAPRPHFWSCAKANDFSAMWSDVTRVAIIQDGSLQKTIEVALRRHGPGERAVFVRVYGMIAILLHKRPAVFIDQETLSYLFSAPLLNHPNNLTSQTDGAYDGASEADDRGSVAFGVSAVSRSVGLSAGAPLPSSSSFQPFAAGPQQQPSLVTLRSDSMHYNSPPVAGLETKYQYAALPLGFNRHSAFCDRPTELLTEALPTESQIERWYPPPDNANGDAPQNHHAILLEPVVKFESIVKHVVIPYLLQSLDWRHAAESFETRKVALFVRSTTLQKRTIREAALKGFCNALAICSSRLLYSRDGTVTHTDNILASLDEVLRVIWAADASSARSTVLVIVLGFFAEALQRVVGAVRYAESKGVSSAGQGPGSGSGFEALSLRLSRRNDGVFLPPMRGTESRFRAYLERCPNAEVARILQNRPMRLQEGPASLFNYVAPIRGIKDRALRWTVEAGDPYDPGDPVFVYQALVRPIDLGAFSIPEPQKPSDERRFNCTMPNENAVFVLRPPEDDVSPRNPRATTTTTARTTVAPNASRTTLPKWSPGKASFSTSSRDDDELIRMALKFIHHEKLRDVDGGNHAHTLMCQMDIAIAMCSLGRSSTEIGTAFRAAVEAYELRVGIHPAERSTTAYASWSNAAGPTFGLCTSVNAGYPAIANRMKRLFEVREWFDSPDYTDHGSDAGADVAVSAPATPRPQIWDDDSPSLLLVSERFHTRSSSRLKAPRCGPLGQHFGNAATTSPGGRPVASMPGPSTGLSRKSSEMNLRSATPKPGILHASRGATSGAVVYATAAARQIKEKPSDRFIVTLLGGSFRDVTKPQQVR